MINNERNKPASPSLKLHERNQNENKSLTFSGRNSEARHRPTSLSY